MKLKTLIAAGAVAALATTAFAAAKTTTNYVSFDSAVANSQLVPQVGTGKELSLLKDRQAGSLGHGVVLGGVVRGAALYSRLAENASTTAGSKSVPTHITNMNAGDKTGSQINLPRVALEAVAGINDWTTGVLELGANNVGRTTSSATDNDNLNLDQAYVLIGNLNKSSVYGFIGKKDVDFGNFSTVNFYTMPLDRMAFMVHATNSVGVGFDANNLNAVFTVMNGGSNVNGLNHSTGTAAANTGTAYTQNNSNINNFAANLTYGMNSNGVDWGVGAGYLNGTRFNYRKSATADTTVGSNSNQFGQRNAAWDLNGHFTVKGIKVLGEYVRTSGKASAYALGQTDNSTVQGYNVGAIYGFPLMGNKSTVNADYSVVKTTQESAKQFVLGLNNELYDNVWVGVEWAYNKGLLNGSSSLSGGSATATNITGLPSDNGSKNNTLLLNLTATF